MKLSNKLTVFALAGLTIGLAACQTAQPAITTIATDELLTVKAEGEIYAPILFSRDDRLTEGTMAQIVDHNNVYWCRHETKRPLGFDASVCAN